MMDDNVVFNLQKKYTEEDLDYLGMMKVAGILAEKGDSEAEYVEAEALFLNEMYEKCLVFCKDKRTKKNIDFNEFYIVCLLKLGRYPEVRYELRHTKDFIISDYCVAYIQSVLESLGEMVVPNSNFRVPVKRYDNSFFKRYYHSYSTCELIRVYELQKELIELIGLDIEKEQIADASKSLIHKLKCIHIYSPYKDQIFNLVQEGMSIDPHLIYHFYLENNSAEQLRDTLFLVDLERRLELYTELQDTLVNNGKRIVEAICNCNKTAAMYMIEISLAVETLDFHINQDANNVIKTCLQEIKRWFPNLLDSAEKIRGDRFISDYLSPRSKVMLRAATWQNNAVCTDMGYGFKDAGMLCLSYIRILELEMNERVFPKLNVHRQELKRLLNEINPTKRKTIGEPLKYTNRLKEDIKSFNWTWGSVDKICKTKPSLTSGDWEHFFMIFSKAKEDRKRMELYITLYCYMQEILNDTGMKALESGRFEYFFNEEARERYRNPPAHSRYVTLTIANECRSFVEGVVREMSFYFK